MISDTDFEDFYLASYEKIVRAIAPLMVSAVDVEDIAQEAFARAYRKRDQLASYEAPEAWVRTVAINLACSRWRRVQVATRHLLGSRAPADAPDIAPAGDRHLDLMIAMRRLPQKQREVLVRHYFADESVAEIAKQQRMTEGAVRSHLSRGRVRLAGLLEDF